MAMSSAGEITCTQKRKACLTCTRAKAKCSPSEQRSDVCHRCQRLNKPCVFEERVKKPGPKSRSRVKQLEQRVESLIDLISAKNGPTGTTTNASIVQLEDEISMPEATPNSSEESENSGFSTAFHFPSRSKAEQSAFHAYDPVAAGIIEAQHAYRLLNTFKTSFTSTFPFVVVEADASVLRQQQPFLFHAILTVTSYDTPRIQCLLEDEFRRQIARTIEHARQDLEILQGLLVYTAWYHAFMHPTNQQLAVIVQLCVALVQELGLSRNKKKTNGLASIMRCGPESVLDEMAGKRAFLGTYFLTVTFAQVWRRRTTLSHTRFMAQCCASFAGSAVATDVLITPLIQLCELSSRVNDHFSYDDIENSEIQGELLLEISTSGFYGELTRIKDACSISPLTKHNTTLNMTFSFLDAWIHECCLHSSRWQAASQHSTLSLTRIAMLRRTMGAVTSLANAFLHTPEAQLYHLTFQSWTICVYAVIIICKSVFLEDNERIGNTHFDIIPEEIDNLIPQNLEGAAGPHNIGVRVPGVTKRSWDPLVVSREYDIQGLFARFLEKLRFTLPPDCPPWTLSKDKRDSLHALACLLHTLIHGFTKRFQRFVSSANTQYPMPGYRAGPEQSEASTTATSGFTPATTTTPNIPYPMRRPSPTHSGTQKSRLGFVNMMNFESLNFDSITLPAASPVQQNDFDDLIWDSIMDDFSMTSF